VCVCVCVCVCKSTPNSLDIVLMYIKTILLEDPHVCWSNISLDVICTMVVELRSNFQKMFDYHLVFMCYREHISKLYIYIYIYIYAIYSPWMVE
jgi:hypothetical protein